VDAQTGEVDRSLLPAPDKERLLRRETPCETPYFYGCAYAARAYAISVAGMYPERLVYGMEELDLSLRLVEHGYTIVFDPTIAVLHHTASGGRDFVGGRYWRQQALNKSRVAWRQLPMPYPLTVAVIWSAATLVKTRRPRAALAISRALWSERATLRAERRVISPETRRYLRRVGARLLY
jgi:GT2 family glycosyltransferase